MPHRKRQRRRKPRNRRPKYYWTNPDNLERELIQFWQVAGVKPSGILIPNETLLQFYNRHDLRAAIASQGGRTMIAEKILAPLKKQVRIMPGKWSQAWSDIPELQQLVELEPSLSRHSSPYNSTRRDQQPQEPTETTNPVESSQSNNLNSNNSTATKWSHTENRKPKGYWSLQRVIQELYEYVDGVKQQHGRPAVWMPRPNEMTASGRDDLKQAMVRFGGSKKICKLARMVPFREWYYFEGLLELLQKLKAYLDEYCEGDYSTFPSVSEIRRNGHETLHSLIQYYGGRKFVAARLSMKAEALWDDALDFGPFDLEFGETLLLLVRMDQFCKAPPTNTPVIDMPSRSKLEALLGKEQAQVMHEKILEYGGYENVARRLGLAFFVDLPSPKG